MMMEENKKTIILQKIPLKRLLETLEEIYNQGADYIDISGVPNVEQDIIGIHVREDYMADEEDFDFEENDDEEELKSSDLSDDDLNQLI